MRLNVPRTQPRSDGKIATGLITRSGAANFTSYVRDSLAPSFPKATPPLRGCDTRCRGRAALKASYNGVGDVPPELQLLASPKRWASMCSLPWAGAVPMQAQHNGQKVSLDTESLSNGLRLCLASCALPPSNAAPV